MLPEKLLSLSNHWLFVWGEYRNKERSPSLPVK